MLSEKKQLISKRKSLFEKLMESETWIMGSIIETERIQSGRAKPFYYLSRSLGGKTKTTYIAKKNLAAFKKARLSGRTTQKIINEIVELNIKLVKIEKEG